MGWKRCLQILPSLLGVVLLGVSVWVLYGELKHYPPGEIWRSLSVIPARQIIWAVLLTCLNGIVFTGYDSLAVQSIHHALPYRQSALVSLIAIPISNTIGFALLSDGAIRYRFYRTWGLSALEITQVIAFCHLSFWLGLFAMGGITFLTEPIAIPALLHLPFKTVHPVGGLFLSTIAAYLIWNGISRRSLCIKTWSIPRLPLPLCLTQIAIAASDWALSAAVLYVLLPPTAALSYPAFFGTYLLAQFAGVVSTVPGGLGVFETVILLLLSPSIPSSLLLGTLLVYRVTYYLLPLAGAIGLLGLYELRHRAA